MITRWRQRRKAKELARRFNQLNELREFVYLDEVSVTSLIASREGAVPHEFTYSENVGYKGELNGQAEATAGVFKGRVGSKFERSSGTNSQILSKATVQTLFKLLREIEDKNLVVKRRLISDATAKDADDVVVTADKLNRGALVELEVELETDGIFQLSTMIGTLKDLADEHEELRSQIDPGAMSESLALAKIVEKMLVGLIPLRCRVVDYQAATTKSCESVMVRRGGSLPENIEQASVEDLYLVGDTDQTLYWKDIRRILFSGSRFRIFCRLNTDGIGSNWNPVKLTELLKLADPDMAVRLKHFGAAAVGAMSGLPEIGQQVADVRTRALVTYAQQLVEDSGLEMTPELEASVRNIAVESQAAWVSVAGGRTAFEKIEQAITDNGCTVDTKATQHLRTRVREQHGLNFDGQPEVDYRPYVKAAQTTERVLDAEIIAIYW